MGEWQVSATVSQAEINGIQWNACDIRDRISQAARVLFGREQRNAPLPFEFLFKKWGMPAPFKPGESLDAYGDNPWLAGAVDKIAREVARTKFHLQTVNRHGELTLVQKTKLSIPSASALPSTSGRRTVIVEPSRSSLLISPRIAITPALIRTAGI